MSRLAKHCDCRQEEEQGVWYYQRDCPLCSGMGWIEVDEVYLADLKITETALMDDE